MLPGAKCVCPLLDGLAAEAGDRGELGAQGMAVIAERDGGDERDLVLRAPTDLAAAALTTEVGIVDLNLALEAMALLALDHRLHQLVVNEPRGRVAHPRWRFRASADRPVFA
jgi:hypothetical protein